jgi:hypothetical protein
MVRFGNGRGDQLPDLRIRKRALQDRVVLDCNPASLWKKREKRRRADARRAILHSAGQPFSRIFPPDARPIGQHRGFRHVAEPLSRSTLRGLLERHRGSSQAHVRVRDRVGPLNQPLRAAYAA